MLSLSLHLVIIILGMFLSHSSTIRHTFIVLGVHSKKESKTLFKKFGYPVNSASTVPLAVRKPVVVPIKKTEVKANLSTKKVCATPKKEVQNAKSSPKSAVPVKKPSTALEVAQPKIEHQKKAPQQPKKVELSKKKEEPKKESSQQKNVKEQANKNNNKNNDAVTQADVQSTKAEDSVMVPDALDHNVNTKSSNQSEKDKVILAFADRDMIVYQQHIRQEIEQRWQPPLGVPKGTECTVRFEVGRDGVVKNAELLRRSNILIFDLSTVRSARACLFARCLWGKTFQVDFRQ